MAGILNDGKPAANWNRVIPHTPIQGGWHTYGIEVKGKHVRFIVDGKLQAEADNVVKDRYFIISVDPYTSHYSGTWTIDYIQLTGESVVSSAIESDGKIAVTWGNIKSMQ